MVEHQAGLRSYGYLDQSLLYVIAFSQRSEKVCLHATNPVASKDLKDLRSFCRSSILFEEKEMAVSSAYMLTRDLCKEKANH